MVVVRWYILVVVMMIMVVVVVVTYVGICGGDGVNDSGSDMEMVARPV